MAVIQLRSGAYADYDPTKMHSAELAVILSGDPATEDGKSLNICFGSSDTRRVLTEDDVVVPPPPSSNGTYYLKCTVASGVVTYTWASS